MFRKISLLAGSLFITLGFAFAASAANRVIYVLVDPVANRAYVPEGTVLPNGMQVRAQAVKSPDAVAFPEMDDSLRHSFAKMTNAKRAALRTPPLVIEYAPAERFEAAKQRYQEKHPQAAAGRLTENYDYCFDVYASQENTGIYGTYTDGITLTFCANYNTVVGNAYPWHFTVTGDYSYKDNYINPAVGIYDQNNNFNCYDEYQYNFDLGQCTAENTTVWTNSGCPNYVHGWGLLYVIEYTNDPYHDEYVGFNLDIGLCCTFY